ncbi:autoinducer 2-degrading protein [Constrictibacter sp. MBR-5]|jgi:quinol monooxygenase YgiN|uniref:putative quinol monooxygenase n=1 Tax=Constrictibacter sp. MBR-5 TaxID=3156467 RepID=UPI00339A9612
MSKVAIAVEFHVKPEHRTAFEAIIREHARLSRETEPGCVRFDVLVPKKDDGRILLFELYADEKAFQDHSALPRLAETRERYKDMITERRITVCSTD